MSKFIFITMVFGKFEIFQFDIFKVSLLEILQTCIKHIIIMIIHILRTK